MTQPRDLEALLSAYLVEGMEVLPDRVADSVLEKVHRTRQRDVFGPWRTRSMLNPSLAVAAVVAVLVVGALLTTRRDQPVISNPSPSVPGFAVPSSTPDATGPNPSAFPRTTGVWITTGSMGTPRSGHTAVRLLDGRVLVAGGYPSDEPDSAVTSAELYDPATGTWSATGNMLRPHDGFPATLLRDGKVLVGDIDDPAADNPVMGAEIYDPATGTWSATGPMVNPDGGSAVLLRDGRVLVVHSFGKSELYDPDSGTWTATGQMLAYFHQSFASVLMPDGKVLVAGGGDGMAYAGEGAELYDPESGTWTAIASMNGRKEVISATLLRDGTVLVMGNGFLFPMPPELYDPATEAWTVVGEGDDCCGSATLLPDGTVLVAGAHDSPDAELYDPGTRSWKTTGSMLGAHSTSPLTLLLDGTVLAAGGATGSAELFVPAGVSPPPAVAALPSPTPTPVPTAPPPGAWIATGAMGTPRAEHTAVRLLDGRVLVVGGGTGDQDDLTAELYDPKSGTWSATGSMVKPHARGFAATLLRDGKVLVGEDVEPGTDPSASGILGAEVYDPASGTWAVTGKMVTVVREGIPTLLRDGRVLVVHPGSAERSGSAELYDPDTGTWTATGKMVTRGLGAGAAVLLPDGKVLVPGGNIHPRMLDSAELYDPDTGTWTVTARMNAPRDEITATLLDDGTVLVAGPSASSTFPPTSAELYDPASGTWTVTGDMAWPEASYRTATLLHDGTVLVTGAQRDPELYNPSTRSWTPFWTMLGPHDGAPATLLLDGRVLVAGGSRCSTDTGECATTRSAELYDPGATSTASPPPTLAPTPVPIPTPVPPSAGPGGRPWKITVSNNSSRPATLFVAEESEQGLMGRPVGSATPSVVLPGTTVKVTFLVPATGVDRWSIFVNPGPDTRGVVGWTDRPPSGSIHINEEGLSGWMGEG